MTCSHTTTEYHQGYNDDENDDDYGAPCTIAVEVSAWVDTSLHSYRCTVCGEVGYYSQRGRIAEEKGIDVMSVSKEMIAADVAGKP